MQNFESSPHQTPDTNNWDMSDVPFAGGENAPIMPAEANPSDAPNNAPSQNSVSINPTENIESPTDPAETAIANVSYWGEAYNNLEAQFIKYRETVNLNDPETRSSYKTMLRRYEEEIHNVWGYMEDATKTANSYNRLGDPYSRSAAQGINIYDNKEGATVEASSSIFYATRAHALEQAIAHDTPLTPEERKSRDELVASTWSKVEARITANQAMSDRRKDGDFMKRFRECNELHDDLIRHLNQLNDLAESYGLERFTPRNFITNDWNYQESRDHNLDYHARVESDRTIVDYYFRQVFSREYSIIDRKTSRSVGYAA